MFSDQKSSPKKARKGADSKDTSVSILTSGCHFNGRLYCRGSSRIGGKIEGQIISEGLLIVEESATINADIKAEEVIIQGTVEGRLESNGRVEMASNSSFQGIITTPILVISEGAKFNGQCSMPINDSYPKPKLVETSSEKEMGMNGPMAVDANANLGNVNYPDVNVHS